MTTTEPITRWLERGNHIVVAPGWRDSGEDHWQTRWCDEYPGLRRVQQRDWENPQAAAWVKGLDQQIPVEGQTLLVAHSLGCITVGHWAALSSKARHVAAALLVAPADVTRDEAPDSFRGFMPLPARELPFPSLLVASDNDPSCSLDRAVALSQAWGSELVPLSGVGHINVDSGHGEWPVGLKLLRQLLRKVSKA
ncbi:alpha/beta hydrolase [Silvimonas sp. JCM 19000]